jgi:hypothetical protein
MSKFFVLVSIWLDQNTRCAGLNPACSQLDERILCACINLVGPEHACAGRNPACSQLDERMHCACIDLVGPENVVLVSLFSL